MIQSVRDNTTKKSSTEAEATTAIKITVVIGQGIEIGIMDIVIEIMDIVIGIMDIVTGIGVMTEVTAIVKGIGVMSDRTLGRGPMTLQSILIGMYLESSNIRLPGGAVRSDLFVNSDMPSGNGRTLQFCICKGSVWGIGLPKITKIGSIGINQWALLSLSPGTWLLYCSRIFKFGGFGPRNSSAKTLCGGCYILWMLRLLVVVRLYDFRRVRFDS